jgi:ABC-2 type transport system ATP-binding protein
MSDALSPASESPASSQASGALVSVVELSKRFGQHVALESLSFELYPGEVVGLLGPNGAGKTTTLKLLLGLLKPSHGHASILGLDCTSDELRVKERIGYTPDEPQFYDFLSGREIIDFVISVRGLTPTEAWQSADELIALLQLKAELSALSSTYSLGMRKKLALVCALLHRPRVLLLDEPTNGLDPPTAHRVRELLLQHAAGGATVFLSTHLLDMADRLCHRMLVIHHGRRIAAGTSAELRAQIGASSDASLEEVFLQLVSA